jgi:hypothetical protein
VSPDAELQSYATVHGDRASPGPLKSGGPHAPLIAIRSSAESCPSSYAAFTMSMHARARSCTYVVPCGTAERHAAFRADTQASALAAPQLFTTVALHSATPRASQ